jgi:multidrug efflux pump subunit AcrA (membrane-fusion protein)
VSSESAISVKKFGEFTVNSTYFTFCLIFASYFLPDLIFAQPSTKSKAVVYVQPAKKGEQQESVTAIGTVKATKLYPFFADTEGILQECVLGLGRWVQKGEKLCQVSNPDPSYQFVPSPVLSPVSGVISAIEALDNTRVARGQKIGTITDVANTKVVIDLTQEKLKQIKLNSKGTFWVEEELENAKKRMVAVQVATIHPNPHLATRTVSVELSHGEGERLPAGSFGKVVFSLGKKQVILIPSKAIQYRGKKSFLRFVEDNKVTYKEVTLGNRQGEMTEIIGGVTPGEKIITKAPVYVSEGEEVNVELEKEVK